MSERKSTGEANDGTVETPTPTTAAVEGKCASCGAEAEADHLLAALPDLLIPLKLPMLSSLCEPW
jgi:hypothetical protein